MMKHLVVILGFAIVGWTAPAYSRDEAPEVVPDPEQIIAQEIEKGAPTRTTGIEVRVIPGVIFLEAYSGDMKGKKLRAREITLLPGARIAVHSHHKRPGVVHVLEGELVEHLADREEPVIRRQGDTYYEGLDVVHWSENVSPNRTRVLTVDIFPGDAE